MAQITFDPLKFANRLKQAGLTEVQATAISEAQKEDFAEVLATSLATKLDIARLEATLDLETTLLQWMGACC